MDVIEYLDEQKAKTQAMNEVLEIQGRLTGFDGILVQPHRLLLKDAELANGKRAFLFSDLLLICIETGKKNRGLQSDIQLDLLEIDEAEDDGSDRILIRLVQGAPVRGACC